MVGSDGLLSLHDEVAGVLLDNVGSEFLLTYISGSFGREISELLEISSSGKATLDCAHLISSPLSLSQVLSLFSHDLCSVPLLAMLLCVLLISSSLLLRILLALCSGDCLGAICCSVFSFLFAQIPAILFSCSCSSSAFSSSSFYLLNHAHTAMYV